MSATGYYIEPLLDKCKFFENLIFYIPGSKHRVYSIQLLHLTCLQTGTLSLSYQITLTKFMVMKGYQPHPWKRKNEDFSGISANWNVKLGSREMVLMNGMRNKDKSSPCINMCQQHHSLKEDSSSQPAMECLPLVMEPESGFYSDPVVVLDFQSLYPSMIIAYNLCFSTCLGKVGASKTNTLGVQRGILLHLLEEILSTRIMVKQAMKKLSPSEQVLQRIFNARQLALKLISNVTYGYTVAGFSGRMPCAELTDSIVQCGRCTLEKAISFVNLQEKWNAKVIYGDTDSMFVLLKGRTVKEAFQIWSEIAAAGIQGGSQIYVVVYYQWHAFKIKVSVFMLSLGLKGR